MRKEVSEVQVAKSEGKEELVQCEGVAQTQNHVATLASAEA